MATLEESFPRGGTRKTHKPEKSFQQSVEQDNLFDISTEEESTKRKKIQKEKTKTKRLKIEKRESSKSKKEKFEILSVESLCEGMRILGCVKEVNELELVVSLPNGLQGFVQVTEICDAYNKKLNEQVAQEEPLQDLLPLTELFSPGMLVRCVVRSVNITENGKKSVKLSLNPKNVNRVLSAEALKSGMLLTGTVSSLEDHGYLVDIGVGGTRAFLPLPKAQDYIRQKNKGAKLKLGQYLTCIVDEVKSNGGVVSLSIGHSEISTALATEEQNWTLSNLLPGLVVKAQVQKVTPFGLKLNFLTFFTGVVDFMHLEPKKVGTYISKQTVRACILCVHPRTRIVRLSLRPIFLQPGRPLTRLSCQHLGAVLDDVPVRGFFNKAGATFTLKDGALAYARLSHLSDSKKVFNPDAFKPGNTHKCRIIDYSQMDELALLSLKTSIIKAQYLRYHDIKTGAVVKGTVLTIKPFGMLVKVGEQIKGLVPTMHLADILIKNPEKKYHIGDEVKCRVLLCDPEAKKLIMTLKKTLIMSKLPIITSYNDAKPGLQTHGVILRARDYGCIVKFYNDVQGLVPKPELSAQYIPDPEKVFFTGQVVKVAVLNCEPSKERMLLSFKLLSEPEPENESVGHSQKKKRAVNIGQLVDVKVLEKTRDGLEVAVLPHNIPAFLPTPHLSDHVTNGPLLYHWLQAGDTLHRVLCLSQSEKHLLLCRKPSLVSTVEGGQDPKSFSEIQPGMLLIGFVRSIMDYGVFVQFPSGLSGLAPKALMSDKFVTTPSDHFVEGQTVVAKVTNVDEEKQRMLLSLRLSDCTLGKLASTSLLLLSQCLEELQGVRSLMSNRADSVLIQTLAEMTPGMVLDLVVQEVLEDGSVVFSGGPVPDLVVRASRYHRTGQEVEPGQKKKVVVLSVDMLKLEVHVSLSQHLVNRKAKRLKKGSRYQGIVQHLEESFAVASLVETGQLAAFSLTSHLNDTFRFDSEKLQVGQGVCLTLKTTEPGVTGLLLAVEGPAAKRTMTQIQKNLEAVDEEEEDDDPALTTGTKKKHSLAIGDIVTGTIKSIKATHVVVTLEDDIIGCIHASNILDDVPVGSSPTTKLKVGKTVTARVIGGRDVKTSKFLPISHPRFIRTILELSVRPSDLEKDGHTALDTYTVSPMEKIKQFQAGQTVICFLKKFNVVKKWLEVEIAPDIRGRIPLLLTSLSFKVLKHPDKNFRIGQALKAMVVSSNSSKAFLCLSLIGPHKLERGEVAMGQVVTVIPNEGLTVSFPSGKMGRVSIFDVSDSYSEAPLEEFIPQKVVRCYVLSTEDQELTLSLRSSRTNPETKNKIEDPEINSIQDIKEGQLLRGYVKSIQPNGVLLGLGPSVEGLAQYSHVSRCSQPRKDLYSKYLPEGKLLTARILSLNYQKNLVELSFLPSDTGKPDVFSASPEPPLVNQKKDQKEEEEKKKKKVKKSQKGKEEVKLLSEKKELQRPQKRQGKRERQQSESEQEGVNKRLKKAGTLEEDKSSVEVYYREEEEEIEVPKLLPKGRQTNSTEVPRLQLSSGFIWDVGLNSLTPALPPREESSDSEEEEKPHQATQKKKSKKERELEKQKAEKDLCHIEEALMDPGRQPESADDFDRLVLSSPNSSILWLQYMAFHLQATEIEKARAVAERALKTISFREEQEKLNVWVALLNLENMYGSEESLTKVFERAVQYNEPLKVFLHLADIYTKSEKFKEAGDLYNRMLKRFRQDKVVWIKYGAFVLRRNQAGASHRVLQRALECLPTKEHVDVIAKFAQLEFQLGDAERAKAIFENMLSTYPKRTDVWSVYIDMVIKHGSQKEVRDIFQRVIHLSLAPKRMKFFFKRYLDYEKQYGTEKDVQAVKAKALEYVEAKSSVLED
ncbi:protein RRP5 homolog isoform X1 [Dipodomys spectabilis]|uniref:protein RRP5 homolog isoform X1 n=1 Tax=Dipodomys spectabilis TaxID=105255 RepID=UPI001C539504|nr:protein RRP5 homolog isoform X1 [Dipodomys spectabilis]XP_042545192.1 protein RRP5 homolog isoform X1 [Dipodomys spectabilis]XP_042545193.1 protein RRP5 homolog isoform X1 [Dipodomys spectabilis]